MGKYTVIITKTVQKKLQKLPDKTATKLENKMLELEEEPRPRGCKKLQGRDGYRIRVGDYRIIYDVQNDILIVTVLDLGHRQGIY